MRIPILVVKVVLLLVAGLFLYSLYARQPDVDDAWLGEHAWYQSKLGYVKSELMHGVTHQEERTLIHHKLLTLHGSAVISLFGFSLYSLKVISLIYFLLFIALLFWYLVLFRGMLQKEEFLILLLLLLAHPLVFDMSFVYRPEVPMMFYGFLTFIFLNQSVMRERRPLLAAFAGGLTAGVCMDFHLNGLIFIAAGAAVLLVFRNFRGALLFLSGCILTGAIYFYDFTKDYGFAFWLAQITESPFHTRTSDYFSWKTMVIAFFREHLRFFHGAGISAFSLLGIFALAVGWRTLKKMPVLSVFSLFLILCLAVIALYKTPKYMVSYLPLLMVLLVLVFKERGMIRVISERKAYFVNGFALFFMVLFLGISVYLDFRLAMSKFNPDGNRMITKQYFPETSGEKQILAPMDFIFNEMGRYKGIQGLLQYDLRLHTDQTCYGAGLLTHAAGNGVDCLYLNRKYLRIFGLTGVKRDSVIAGYKVIDCSPELLVMDRVK